MGDLLTQTFGGSVTPAQKPEPTPDAIAEARREEREAAAEIARAFALKCAEWNEAQGRVDAATEIYNTLYARIERPLTSEPVRATYNHTREDSPLTPCPECVAAEQGREQDPGKKLRQIEERGGTVVMSWFEYEGVVRALLRHGMGAESAHDTLQRLVKCHEESKRRPQVVDGAETIAGVNSDLIAERNQLRELVQQYEQRISIERESCALIADFRADHTMCDPVRETAREIAIEIRKRGDATKGGG
jgi:hypothetical protein